MTKKQIGVSILVMALFLIWDIILLVKAVMVGNHIEGWIDFICTCVSLCFLIPTIILYIRKWRDKQ